MNLYTPSYVLERCPDFAAFVASAGARCESDHAQAVAGTVHLHDTHLTTLALSAEVVRSQAGFEPEFVRAKNGLASIDVSRKDSLHEALLAAGMQSHDSVFPKTLSDVESFFDKHPAGVFCKPVLGEGAMRPQVPQAQGLLRPTELARYYKRFSSFAEFKSAVDLENLLQLQNSDRSLAIHQCMLQACYPDAVKAFFISGVAGNPGTPLFFRTPNIRVAQATPLAGLQSFSPAYMRSGAQAKSRAPVRSMAGHDVDSHGLHAAIKQFFASAGISNTYFAVQGMFDAATGAITIDDVDFRLRIHHYRGVTPAAAQNELRFLLGQEAAVTEVDPQYWQYFDVIIPGGLTAEMMKTARALNIQNTIPVKVGWPRVSFMARADTPDEVTRNIDTFTSSFRLL